MYKNQTMGTKEVEEVAPDVSKVSDGYHTFEELYDHRATIFIALCRRIEREWVYGYAGIQPEIWCSKNHSDGTVNPDWFLLGINRKRGKQITYHLPIKFWPAVQKFATVLKRAPCWDGHSSQDVLVRLSKL